MDELPLRLFEFGHVYRHEKSGVIHGLTRVRGFAQDDSHSYVTKEQAPEEIRHLLDFVLGLLRDFGLDDYYLELSTREEYGDKKDKFIGSDEQWAEATAVLEQVAVESGLELVAELRPTEPPPEASQHGTDPGADLDDVDEVGLDAPALGGGRRRARGGRGRRLGRGRPALALGQVPGLPTVLGIGLVVTAGVGAECTGARR